MDKRFVYICAPFKGDRKGNIEKAKEYSKQTYNEGYIPICVHMYLEEATGLDEEKGNRKELLRLGKEFVRICDEVWVFGEKISEGMKGEIEVAEKKGKKVVFKGGGGKC